MPTTSHCESPWGKQYSLLSIYSWHQILGSAAGLMSRNVLSQIQGVREKSSGICLLMGNDLIHRNYFDTGITLADTCKFHEFSFCSCHLHLLSWFGVFLKTKSLTISKWTLYPLRVDRQHLCWSCLCVSQFQASVASLGRSKQASHRRLTLSGK